MKRIEIMKKKFVLFFLALIVTFFGNAQIVNIPNGWLKANILSTNTTTNLRAKDLNGNWLKIDQNDDGEVQISEALNVSFYYDANALSVSTYEGINSFSNLESLYFANNQYPTSLDLSGLNHLKILNCYFNNLTSINLNGCNSLESINLNQNYLTTLDVSGIGTLKDLTCQNNDLISVNLNATPSLINLLCYNNNITSLNLDNHPNLQVLNCTNNSLTNLTFNNCLNLNSLSCSANNLQILNVNNAINLVELYCGGNHLQTLDVSNCSLLIHLDCTSNNLISLNINNGVNWIPSYNYAGSFSGLQNSNINQVCTSTSSVPSMLSYYSPFTSNVSNCSALSVNGNEINKLKFYPNPAKDRIFFTKIITLISVYDIKGLLIKNYILNNNEMNISELSTGLYFLKIHAENEIIIEKLVIE